MKTRPLPAFVPAVLAAVLLAAVMPQPSAFAQSTTDAKIRLTSEALRARDAGDIAGARKALDQLAALSPNDPAVQKLRAEIEAQAIAQQNALAQRAAAAQAALAAPPPAAVASTPPPAAPAATPGSPAMIDV